MRYLTEPCTMPFCKGCGHSHVLHAVDRALGQLALPPERVALVTDIGCIGLADNLFPTVHTVHTTHGRSTAFATGIELADSVMGDSRLATIVLIGDGGAMIGLLHLVNAALLNANMTVILCNNFLFGMTGGQHSAFSPLGFVTPTTPTGNIVPPLDLCRVLIDAHAGYVARITATDKTLPDVIAEAIRFPGFALVEIVELCTEHAIDKNEITGQHLKEIVERHGQQFGVLCNREDRAEFGKSYQEKFARSAAGVAGLPLRPLAQKFQSSLRETLGVIIAGSAGERVQSAARAFCEAAMTCGLHCTQKNDNPVTQGSGFSLSEVILSPAEIHFTGIGEPAAVIIVSEDGLRELQQQGRFATLTERTTLIIDSSLEKPVTQAMIIEHPFRKEFGPKKAALRAVEFFVRRSKVMPADAFEPYLPK